MKEELYLHRPWHGGISLSPKHAQIQIFLNSDSELVPKVGGTTSLGAVRNSTGAVKQKWVVEGR